MDTNHDLTIQLYSTYGTAKQANSISVKALAGPEGAGNSRITMDALIWVAKEVEANMGNGRQSVINMSLGGPRTNLLNSLVDTMVDQLGIHIIVAAGNDNLNACNFSPASAERVITVGASNGNDRRAEFSNFGSCVDIFAPGQNVLSTAPDQGLNRGSGTSYAAPMVAGMVVNLLSSFPDMTPAEVRAYLIQDATPDALSNIGVNSPNLLAYQDCDVLLQSELAVPNAGGSEGDGTNIASVDDGNSTLIIGVAAAVAVALLIALIALVLCCRKKKAPAKGMSTKNSWNRSDEPLASMGATGSV
ncbi:hypothetical protein SARC_03076 [Sphaeroforma arctica JP610]|uniref:Peptidase S8/S53 domain-containing protein n=1 Tax=Sphaeroforma arctica JP610 TaxID=667725 RepID=A0A0L0G751_9EUKA|nr:hypothetical protein SARC_03076 [Sphaeroforma arctica JP610]KNC84701.1 hypothetical protein SARC_03076 [Sphaeroforma arctica JP610]|eukprot:XP_014158603.1 hypothetical protein SARC_03076 [Sphaeroforma arctica JP610]